MSKFDKTYSNGEITIFWKPDMCVHSAKCFYSLPEVFNPKERPWVKLENSNTAKIVETVKNCPSGALSFSYNKENDNVIKPETVNQEQKSMEEPLTNSVVRINVAPNGPFLVNGSCVIVDKDGVETIKEGKFALCRCGQSTRKPFCDGTHKTLTFDL